MVGPYLTTTNYNPKRKLNAKQKRAVEEHEAWLRSRGIGAKTKTEKITGMKYPLPEIGPRWSAKLLVSNCALKKTNPPMALANTSGTNRFKKSEYESLFNASE
jgi:hypothetical protein